MHVIRTRNVHTALPLGLRYLDGNSVPMPSRNGDVFVARGPVTTVYVNPCERVLFWPERDANPFLHFFDAMWCLAGRNDVALLARFAARMASFSDDGTTLHGAYGYRLRNFYQMDQLDKAVDMLTVNPWDRRVVLQLWDANEDLGRQGNDLPCNQQLMLRVAYGRANERNRLHMMVTSRSHDIIWGLYGANAVQFSYIQEYLAGRLNLEVGTLTNVSWNYHAYDEVYRKTYRGGLHTVWAEALECPYATGEVKPYPLMIEPDAWGDELEQFMDDQERNGPWVNPFFPEVAQPLWLAHARRKDDPTEAMRWAKSVTATDWRKAAVEWLERRQR